MYTIEPDEFLYYLDSYNDNDVFSAIGGDWTSNCPVASFFRDVHHVEGVWVVDLGAYTANDSRISKFPTWVKELIRRVDKMDIPSTVAQVKAITIYCLERYGQESERR